MSQNTAPRFTRPAFAPAVLAAIVLLAGLALLDDTNGHMLIRMGTAVLALIVAVIAVQARHWWWAAPMAAIAILWNPVFPFDFSGQWWVAGQYAAVLVFLAAGYLTRQRRDESPAHPSRR